MKAESELHYSELLEQLAEAAEEEEVEAAKEAVLSNLLLLVLVSPAADSVEEDALQSHYVAADGVVLSQDLR
jgi:hypothetical protein